MPTRLLQFGSVQGPGVPTQTPSWHVSVVQASPSLHGAVLLLCRQPPAPSQVSSVQGLPSSQMNWPAQTPPWQVSLTVQVLPSLQSGAGPPTQAPARQVSPVVQALPSSQGATLGTFAQTPAVQLSSVHGLPSSQSA